MRTLLAFLSIGASACGTIESASSSGTADDALVAELAATPASELGDMPGPGAYSVRDARVHSDACAQLVRDDMIRSIDILPAGRDALVMNASNREVRCSFDALGIGSCEAANGPRISVRPGATLNAVLEVPVMVRKDVASFSQLTVVDLRCEGGGCPELEAELDIKFPCQTELLHVWQRD